MAQLINNDLNQNKESLLYNKSQTINNYLNNNICSGSNDFNSYSNLQFQSPLLSPSLPNSSLLNINNNETLFDRFNKQNLLFSQDNNNYNNSNLTNDKERNFNFFNKYLDSLENENYINILPKNFLNNNIIQNQFQTNNNQIPENIRNQSNENLLNVTNAEYSNISQKNINITENESNTNKDSLVKDTKKFKGNTD